MQHHKPWIGGLLFCKDRGRLPHVCKYLEFGAVFCLGIGRCRLFSHPVWHSMPAWDHNREQEMQEEIRCIGCSECKGCFFAFKKEAFIMRASYGTAYLFG